MGYHADVFDSTIDQLQLVLANARHSSASFIVGGDFNTQRHFGTRGRQLDELLAGAAARRVPDNIIEMIGDYFTAPDILESINTPKRVIPADFEHILPEFLSQEISLDNLLLHLDKDQEAFVQRFEKSDKGRVLGLC